MRFRSHARDKREFLASRTVQEEADFLANCGLPEESVEAALAVRKAIATLGGVDPGYVHALDSFARDLSHFDFWGSLDSVAVVLELEHALRVHISDEQAQRMPDPELVDDLTVADFIRSVLEVLQI
jgi:acyl carrier protein